jgi:hypothetical protein
VSKRGIDVEWIDSLGDLAPRIPVGPWYQHWRQPNGVVLVREQGRPLFAIDVYPDPSEYQFRTSAIVWHDWVACGYGHNISLVNVATRQHHTYSTDFCSLAYFAEFYIADEFLVAATGCGLMRFDSDGTLRWQTADLGIDGVVVHEIQDDRIRGSGEWDPPGGWLRFVVDATTGAILEQDLPSYERPSN